MSPFLEASPPQLKYWVGELTATAPDSRAPGKRVRALVKNVNNVKCLCAAS